MTRRWLERNFGPCEPIERAAMKLEECLLTEFLEQSRLGNGIGHVARLIREHADSAIHDIVRNRGLRLGPTLRRRLN
jgi:hypothetical protein